MCAPLCASLLSEFFSSNFVPFTFRSHAGVLRSVVEEPFSEHQSVFFFFILKKNLVVGFFLFFSDVWRGGGVSVGLKQSALIQECCILWWFLLFAFVDYMSVSPCCFGLVCELCDGSIISALLFVCGNDFWKFFWSPTLKGASFRLCSVQEFACFAFGYLLKDIAMVWDLPCLWSWRYLFFFPGFWFRSNSTYICRRKSS